MKKVRPYSLTVDSSNCKFENFTTIYGMKHRDVSRMNDGTGMDTCTYSATLFIHVVLGVGHTLDIYNYIGQCVSALYLPS